MRKITTIKKVVFLLTILITIIGIDSSVFAYKAQTEKVLGVQNYQGITWTKLEGDTRQTEVGKYTRYNPGLQSDKGGIKYYNIIEGKDKISVKSVENGQYGYLEIAGKKAGTAKIDVYYCPIGNSKYVGINNYSMKTLTVTITGTGSTVEQDKDNSNSKIWYTVTFLNSKGQNIKLGSQNLVLNRQPKDTLRMPLSPEKLKESGFNLNEDITKYGKFEGWKNVSTGEIYQPGDIIVINSNCNFKAQFKEKQVENPTQKPENNKNDSGNSNQNSNNVDNKENNTGETGTNNSKVEIEKIEVNDILTFTATSWKLYSDKSASKVKAYLLTGDKLKVLEVNNAKVPYILKVEVISANKLKVGNTYYMKYGVTAKGNFKIEKMEEEKVEESQKDQETTVEKTENSLLTTLLKITRISLQTTINMGQQITQILQEEQANNQNCEQIAEGITALTKLGTELLNAFFTKK